MGKRLFEKFLAASILARVRDAQESGNDGALAVATHDLAVAVEGMRGKRRPEPGPVFREALIEAAETLEAHFYPEIRAEATEAFRLAAKLTFPGKPLNDRSVAGLGRALNKDTDPDALRAFGDGMLVAKGALPESALQEDALFFVAAKSDKAAAAAPVRVLEELKAAVLFLLHSRDARQELLSAMLRNVDRVAETDPGLAAGFDEVSAFQADLDSPPERAAASNWSRHIDALREKKGLDAAFLRADYGLSECTAARHEGLLTTQAAQKVAELSAEMIRARRPGGR